MTNFDVNGSNAMKWVHAENDKTLAALEKDPRNGDLASRIDAAQAQAKVDALMQAYATQRGRDWFTGETFMAMLRLRGIECRAPSGYAEGFHGRKLRFGGFAG